MLVIIICDYGDCCVGQFGFMGKFGFWYVGYVDYVQILGVIEFVFSVGRKLWFFYDQVGFVFGDFDFGGFVGFENQLVYVGVYWIGYWYMCDIVFIEEVVWMVLVVIDILVDYYEMFWCIFFVQGIIG